MKIGFIGAGKVGVAMARVLSKKGFTITALSDSISDQLVGARECIGKGDVLFTGDNMDVVNLSDVIAVTTQDRVIPEVVAGIYGKSDRLEGKLFFHTSGAHASTILSPLDKKGAILGSLHPLQTFPDTDSGVKSLPDTFIFIDGMDGAIPLLTKIGRAIGADVVQIDGDKKVLYHLCAVFVCNLLCALLYSGQEIMETIGIGLEPFFPIIRATLKNIEEMGPLMSLTGPVIRGDGGTVASHLEAMDEFNLNKDVYRVLSIVALDMAGKREILDKDVLDRIMRILGDE